MTETTGTDLLRHATSIRNKKHNLTGLARDIGCGVGQLETFIDGGTLPDAILATLTKELFPHAEFVPELDMLRPALQEPAKLLGVPPRLSIPLPRYAPGPGQGPRPVDNAAAAQPKKRAGWIGGWL